MSSTCRGILWCAGSAAAIVAGSAVAALGFAQPATRAPLSPAPSGSRVPQPQPTAAAPKADANVDVQAEDLERRLASDVAPLLARYCIECHGEAKSKGGVRLDGLSSLRQSLELIEDLETAREMVGTREMPPKDKPQPSDHERLILDQWLEGVLAYVPPDAKPDPGWFTIHRLNRNEYRNTLRDLLGIDPAAMDLAAKLPKDDTGYGFDNIADVLSTSTLSVEQYLDAAERAIDAALGPMIEVSTKPKPLGPLKAAKNSSALGSGGFMLLSDGAVQSPFTAPVQGEYLISIEAWETHAGDEYSSLVLRIDGKPVHTFEVKGTRDAPQTFEHRVKLKAGPHTIAAYFANDLWIPDVADRNLAIEQLAVAGPLDESSLKRPKAWTEIFAKTKANENNEGARAAAILNRFAQRAWRRPVRGEERTALAKLYQAQRKEGASFEEAVRTGLVATLVSPEFLFRRVNNPKPNDPAHLYRLDGYELASRLSYFLWSSMPDGPLLDAAADGSLLKDDTLRAQVRRMLEDPKSRAFVENFAGQWLSLRSLDGLAMDTARFPEYDPSLRAAMIEESQRFFADALAGNRSVLSFISSDYTFVNERLASFYGIPDVSGKEFRRVELPQGSPRGGVLTMGSVLTLTSNTTRTSPVKRGLFVLEQILGTPPPPPPADIPPLEQSPVHGENATLREQLAAHVANPSCAACHNRLDPLGLAFEHFDAIGRWREHEGGRPVDATGTLPGGIDFNGSAELKQILLSRGDQFVETLSGKVMMYALGRGLEPFDRPAVNAIARSVKEQNNGFASLIEAVVMSETFRTCRGREESK